MSVSRGELGLARRELLLAKRPQAALDPVLIDSIAGPRTLLVAPGDDQWVELPTGHAPKDADEEPWRP